MVVEPASASGAAVKAEQTTRQTGEASSWERRRQAIARRGGKHSRGEEASTQERQAVARRAARTLSEKLEQRSIV